MANFLDDFSDINNKYFKDLSKTFNFDIHSKIKDFITSSNLCITNVKLDPLKFSNKKTLVILDSTQNKWFLLVVDGKIVLLAKKNTIIHIKNLFTYQKRSKKFNAIYNIKSCDYLVEFVDNVGANLSLALKNWSGNIGKNNWDDSTSEISQMTLTHSSNEELVGYTYNSKEFSFCSIGKKCEKQLDILK